MMKMTIRVIRNDYVRSVTIFRTDLEGRDDPRFTSLIGDVNDGDLTIIETPIDIAHINLMFSDLKKEPTMIEGRIKIDKPFGCVEVSIRKADD